MNDYAALRAAQAIERRELLDKQRAQRDWQAKQHQEQRFKLIDGALKGSGGNREQASHAANCNVRTVYRHVKAFGLPE